MSSSSQAAALEYLAQQELIVDGLCEGNSNPGPFLGGLGAEKTRELAEERASIGRCGNITCKRALQGAKYPSCAANSVAFLKTRNLERVSGRELEQFCGEACLFAFRDLVSTRPMGDVWSMQMLALKSSNEQQQQAVKPKVSSVGEILERQPKKKKTAAAATPTTPEAIKKSVSFAPEVVTSVVELPPVKKTKKQQQQRPPARYYDDEEYEEEEDDYMEEDDDDEEEAEEEGGLYSLMERVDFSQIQLSAFAQASNLLMELTTPRTKAYLQQQGGTTTTTTMEVDAKLARNVQCGADEVAKARRKGGGETGAAVLLSPRVSHVLGTFASASSYALQLSPPFEQAPAVWVLLAAVVMEAAAAAEQHDVASLWWQPAQLFPQLAELHQVDAALFRSLVSMLRAG